MMEKHIIYADHAATTPLSVAALEAMTPFLEKLYGNPSALYAVAREPRKAVKAARQTVAQILGADADEIFFTSCGTESDNWAIKGTAFRYIGQKKRIITSCIEHHAVLHSCAFLEQLGFDVVYLPVDQVGLVSVADLEEVLTPDTILVSVMLANNEIGTIQNIKQLVSATHRVRALFHTDAVQAIGHIPVDVNALGVDLLSASAHKFGGPKGVGFLYKRKGVAIGQFMSGGGQEMHQRAGTENTAGIVGLGAALKESAAQMLKNAAFLEMLTSRFRAGILDAGLDCVFNGAEYRIPGSISVSFRGAEGEMLLHRLDLKDVAVSTGSACNAGAATLSHVLQAVAVPREYINGTIRITLGAENTESEIDNIVSALTSILAGGRGTGMGKG